MSASSLPSHHFDWSEKSMALKVMGWATEWLFDLVWSCVK